MTTPPTQPYSPALSRRRRNRALAGARFALLWERGVRVAWPALAAPMLYAAAAMAGVWNLLGDPWRAVVLGATVLITLVLAVRGARRGPWPTRHDMQRRVEEDSGLTGRPFEALEDRAVAADPAARALWRAHQVRMAAALQAARARRPRAAWAAADRYGLRGVASLTAIAAAIAAGPQALPRLADSVALEPLRAGGLTPRVDAWITPPEYTGQAPIFLRRASNEDGPPASITAPEGSHFVVRVVGGARGPLLRLVTEEGQRRVRLAPDGPDAYAASVALDADASVRLRGAKREDWTVLVTPDAPPVAAFEAEPEPDARQSLTFSFLASDDYPGLNAVLEITRPDTGEVARFDLPPVSAEPDVAVTARLDLTLHPWAGLAVEARIIAIDALGQEGASAPVMLTMPQRLFLNPLAQALAYERSVLVQDDALYAPPSQTVAQTAEDLAALPPFALDDSAERLDRAPEAIQRVRRALDLLTLGDGLFQDDYALQAGLALAAERIARAREREELAGVPDILWDAALHAEGGELENARRELERARRALAEALARGDDQDEINRRLEAFQQAVDRYMELLTAEALAEGRISQGGGGGMGGMDGDALQDMLQALEDLSATGSRDDARRLLQALSEMLENMELQLSMGGGGGSTPPIENEELRDALEELSELQSEQRDLGDDIQQERSGAQPQDGGSGADGVDPWPGEPQDGEGAPQTGEGPADLAQRQRELAERLGGVADALEEEAAGADAGSLEERFGAVLDELAEAGRAMDRAGEALAGGDLEAALDAHGEALQALRDAGTALSERELAERGGPLREGAQDPTQTALDPLGRAGAEGNGFTTGEDTNVPDEIQRQRAREILEELRRRLSEGDRTDEEREYLRRLLERF